MARTRHISFGCTAFAVALVGVPIGAHAEITELPAYAYDSVAQVSMVTTAQTECDGAKVNERRLRRTMSKFLEQLSVDGVDPVAAMQFMDTEVGKAELTSREVELRTRHGVAPEGIEGLCAAIKAELAVNKDLARIVKIP
ncbi:MAG: hypothetical protein KUG69_10360 [Marinosulfonomonas sp.]|nr:hypothetical protein [Marinosulfonomonas sp.]